MPKLTAKTPPKETAGDVYKATKKPQKRCKHCNSLFKPKRTDQVFCEIKCRIAHYVPHACPDCGLMHIPKQNT